MKKNAFFILILTCWTSIFAFGQDNAAIQVEKKIRVTGSEKSDFIFTRCILPSRVDGVPYDLSRSGTYSLGFGYGFPIGKVFEFKLEPRVTWYKLYFAPSQDKWYPSSDSSESLVFEKQRFTYLELPLGLKFKLARNVVDRYRLLIEGGFSLGWRVASMYKRRDLEAPLASNPDLRPKTTTKVNYVEDLNRFRYGPYARIGTNWISFYGFYRMSGIYRIGAKFRNPDGQTTRPFPEFPKLELGISITI